VEVKIPKSKEDELWYWTFDVNWFISDRLNASRK